MTAIVIDNSVVLAWCLADESDALADAAMDVVADRGAVVPGIWWYEVRNALVVNERRKRLTAADTGATLADLEHLGISIDRDHDRDVLIAIARQHDLSVYDAAYLEVAQRRECLFATLDLRLRKAAESSGVELFRAS